MKEKIKKIIFGYVPGFITGIIICGSISVIAATYFPSVDVTYDNKESGLVSTDVQGAIDELYGVCFPKPAGEQIIEDAGLEKDPYECRYFFTGANPNNYITFNNEKAGWRIISVECDGTIKIMKTASIGNQAWDTSGQNNWARPASLNTYLNSTYYNGLNSTAQNQIVAKDWSIGTIKKDNNNLATQINDEDSKKWNGKVALITVSEHIRTNSNESNCGSVKLINDNYMNCKNTTWTNYYSAWWSLTPCSDSTTLLFRIYNSADVGESYAYGEWGSVRPVLYLSSDNKITGGTGTEADPYTLA